MYLTPTKLCFKCNEWIDEEDFYKHPKMLGGRLNKCKKCTKKDVQENYQKKLKDRNWVKKEQKRHREKYYRLKYKDKHRPTPDMKKQAMAKYKGKYPEKVLVANRCSHIKAPEGFEKHHWSYKLKHARDLFFLTPKQHNELHRRLLYCKTGKCYKTKDNILLDTRHKHECFMVLLGVI